MKERLEWIHDVWETEDVFGVEGWNESGLWSYYLKKNNGKIDSAVVLNYENLPFSKKDSKTIPQLRAEGVSWEEINRLYYEGFALDPKRPGCVSFVNEELFGN